MYKNDYFEWSVTGSLLIATPNGLTVSSAEDMSGKKKGSVPVVENGNVKI